MTITKGRLLAFILLASSALPLTARADITTGLVGWWKMDEGTSTIAHDFSGKGNNGTLMTTGSILPQWVTGKIGSALVRRQHQLCERQSGREQDSDRIVLRGVVVQASCDYR
jgi:hypothetical protein